MAFDLSGLEDFQFDWDKDDQSLNPVQGAGIDLADFSGLTEAISEWLKPQQEHNLSLDMSANHQLEYIHPSASNCPSSTPVWNPHTLEPPPVQIQTPSTASWVPTTPVSFPAPQNQLEQYSWHPIAPPDCIAPEMTYTVPAIYKRYPSPELGSHSMDICSQMTSQDEFTWPAATCSQPYLTRSQQRTTQNLNSPHPDIGDSSVLSSAPLSPSPKKKGRPFKYEQTEDRQKANARRVEYYQKRKNEPAFRERVRQYVRKQEQRRRKHQVNKVNWNGK